MNEEERYFLFNKDEDFPQSSLDGLCFENGILTLSPDSESGFFLSRIMDSFEDGCRWRRVCLDCECAEGVELCFYAADSERDLEMLDAIIRSDYKPRGKLVWLEGFRMAASSGGSDFLISGVKARYLAVSVRLQEKGGRAPLLRCLQIWCREESALKYLPEIYQEAGSFLDRFFEIFFSQYLELERGIERLQAHFDPHTANDEELRRLAGMLNIDHVHLWDTKRLRRLLIEDVYRKKGTFSGLKKLVEIYTDHEQLIAERFRMQTGVEENDTLYEGCELTVVLTGGASDLRIVRSLHQTIQYFLPAGVDYALVAAPDGIVLSRHTYLGINSLVLDYVPAILDERNGLQYVILGE